MSEDWSHEEVEAIVSDYFVMLGHELGGEPYSKSRHRAELKHLLNARSDGSIEWKHQNISAALIDLGFPYINGYKPRRNYQRLLFNTVTDRLSADRALIMTVQEHVDRPAPLLERLAIPEDFDTPPRPSPASGRRVHDALPPAFRDSRLAPADYLAREARNQSLGTAGELFVLEFERSRLRRLGADRLAKRVEHVASAQGDSLGFDVFSFELDGREKLIEVKTTAYGKETPFFVTRNEIACSAARPDIYNLYRVYAFRQNPRLFAVAGDLNMVCSLEPTQYLGRVA